MNCSEKMSTTLSNDSTIGQTDLFLVLSSLPSCGEKNIALGKLREIFILTVTKNANVFS